MGRNTIQQDIIEAAVKSMKNHPSPDQVFDRVKESYPNIGRATVYRVLNRLADRGEIKKVSIPNTADRFDFRTDEHVHLHCTVCNRVFDLKDERITEALKTMEKGLVDREGNELEGFKIAEGNLSFKGVCGECQKKENQGKRP
ncbi:MAG TPA: transcriptional repressor [Candidatus Copromorpha excrementigallinarum]|uniref:Transcriptional repressor n=1 Tax=Candidatus Allocopromorpha excrementigallinarum TaxID=2840742 RepID=A0A9D1I0W1_9FIRM|nr:transcriptional repressor [Candidatus Copromorpha excrementigallinarum]